MNDKPMLKLRRLKRKVNSLFFKPHVKIEIGGVKKRVGNDYGGFFIREDILPQRPLVYSFGVGEDISFDLEMIETYHAEVYGFDPTPKSIDWMKRQILPEEFHFCAYGLSDVDGEEEMFLPQNASFVSASVFKHAGVNKNDSVRVPMRRLSTILNEMGHDYIDVLKMDIEGSEYRCLDDILGMGNICGQICMEIHYSYFENPEEKLYEIVDKMRDHGYLLFAALENMDVFTFVNKCY